MRSLKTSPSLLLLLTALLTLRDKALRHGGCGSPQTGGEGDKNKCSNSSRGQRGGLWLAALKNRAWWVARSESALSPAVQRGV